MDGISQSWTGAAARIPVRKGEETVTKSAVISLTLSAVIALVVACGSPAPTEPSVTTIQRASPPIPAPAPPEWLPEPSGPEDCETDPVPCGEALALQHGCVGCHTADGEPSTGPTWQGIFGSREELEDGSSVTVDADYITESIREPALRVVRGFNPVMVAFDADTLPDEDIELIIAYIQSLQ